MGFVSILASASISECVQNAGVVPSSGALVAAFGADAGLCFDVEASFFQDVCIQYPVVPSKLSARSCAFLFQAGSGWVLIFLVRKVMWFGLIAPCRNGSLQ